jgi:hypothetical protein
MSATTPARPAGRIRRRLTHLPTALKVSAVVLVVCVIVGAFTTGLDGALGAAIGALVVVFSFTVSSVVIAWADAVDPRLVLPVGLMTYVLKFTLFGVALVFTLKLEWSGLRPMALTMAVATVAWATAHAVWVWRAKIPYVDVDG